jgi:hypothetical protein
MAATHAHARTHPTAQTQHDTRDDENDCNTNCNRHRRTATFSSSPPTDTIELDRADGCPRPYIAAPASSGVKRSIASPNDTTRPCSTTAALQCTPAPQDARKQTSPPCSDRYQNRTEDVRGMSTSRRRKSSGASAAAAASAANRSGSSSGVTGSATARIVIPAPRVELGAVQVDIGQPVIQLGAPSLQLGQPELTFRCVVCVAPCVVAMPLSASPRMLSRRRRIHIVPACTTVPHVAATWCLACVIADRVMWQRCAVVSRHAHDPSQRAHGEHRAAGGGDGGHSRGRADDEPQRSHWRRARGARRRCLSVGR